MASGALLTPPRAESAPDLFEPLLGYRFWRITASGGLRCLISRVLWSPGVNQASCWRLGHRAPGRICTCGFNALHELPAGDCDGYRNTVIGAIAAWGAVELHRIGFRAEFASVIALADGGVSRPASRRRLTRAADRHSVPLIAIESLAAEVQGHASPADPAMLPGRRSRLRRGCSDR